MHAQFDLLMAATRSSDPLWVARMHREDFTDDFLAYLPHNLHVFDAFVAEVRKVKARGFNHYSARTIIESLRHHSALNEKGGEWKLNNNMTPYIARLCDLVNPQLAGLFEYREPKAAKRDHGAIA
jgi:hypothetical protein